MGLLNWILRRGSKPDRELVLLQFCSKMADDQIKKSSIEIFHPGGVCSGHYGRLPPTRGMGPGEILR